MAAFTPNLANYQPVSSIGGFTLPSTSASATPKSNYISSLATLNTKGIGSPATTGITNKNVLPANFGGYESSNGATAPVPAKITAPTTSSSGSNLNTPAAQQYISSQIGGGNSIADQLAGIKAQALAIQSKIPGATTPGSIGGTNSGTGTTPGSTSPTGGTTGTGTGTGIGGNTGNGTTGSSTTSSAPDAYTSALNDYLAALKSSNSVNEQVSKQTLDANHQYLNTLDNPGGTLLGNQESAARVSRDNNASLADLGIAQNSATDAKNVALEALKYQQALQPSNDPFSLSPGETRYDAKGNIIASAPASNGTAKTIGTPSTGVYQQNADGTWTQTLAPVGGDNVQSLAQELVTGNIAPSDLSKRSTGVGSYSDILTAANKISQQLYGKNFDIAKANTDYKFANNPQTQNTLNYLGSLVGSAGDPNGGNLDQLVKLSQQVAEPSGLFGLGQTNFPALNDATQWARLSSGDPTVAAYYATLLEVSDQVAKILQGGGGSGTSDAKLAQAASLFQKGFTKDQVASVAGALKPLLANRASSMIKDNPYLSSYADQFGITQNNNKNPSSNASNSDTGVVQTAIGAINTNW